jgi:hypothetical protein
MIEDSKYRIMYDDTFKNVRVTEIHDNGSTDTLNIPAGDFGNFLREVHEYIFMCEESNED